MSSIQVYFVALLGRLPFKVKENTHTYSLKKNKQKKHPVLHLLLVIPYILASPISACQTNEFIK